MKNTITVEYENTEYRKLITKKDTVAFVNSVLDYLGVSTVELSVSFIGTENMHQLNMMYRQIDRPTDILSFAVQDGGLDFITHSRKTNIGDMLICPEMMKENAVAFNVSEHEELLRLLIHGTLHLTGHDHHSNDPTEPMLMLQEEILAKLTK